MASQRQSQAFSIANSAFSAAKKVCATTSSPVARDARVTRLNPHDERLDKPEGLCYFDGIG
jgi:hypothetical protein